MGDEEIKAAAMARFDGMGVRFDRVEARLDATQVRLEDHEQRFDGLNRGIEALEGVVSDVAKNTEQALDGIRVVSRVSTNRRTPRRNASIAEKGGVAALPMTGGLRVTAVGMDGPRARTKETPNGGT